MKAIRRLRLASGLTVALFVVTHLANHALGIFSVDAQEAMRRVVSPVYRSLPGTLLLYGALLTHLSLGLYALWRRTTLRMPAWELAQLLLGLTVPLLLLPHAVGARGSFSYVEVDTTYRAVLTAIWSSPESLVRQTTLLLVVAAHLAMGLHFWLRLRVGYARWLVVAYPLAVLLPTLALAGFVRAGLEVRATPAPAAIAYGDYGAGRHDGGGSPGGGYQADVHGAAGGAGKPPAPDPARRAGLATFEAWCYGVYVAALLLVLGARAGRTRQRRREGVYRLQHANGRTLSVPRGQSILEALREARIAHAAVCGGRARCTTCRVRVGRGLDGLPAAQRAEIDALGRIGAAPDVRLACQTRPTAGEVHVMPLVAAATGALHFVPGGGVRGREQRVVVMFIDLRDSSRLGEERLPYDVIFILNRFFAEMAQAVDATAGYYSTFNGDGLMALYGIDGSLREAARNALAGAIAVEERLAALNRSLESELPRPLRVGVGLHAGEAIVGTMGPPATPVLSALGDTVNVAARLEGTTRAHDCALVVSVECAAAAALDMSRFPAYEFVPRGRTTPVRYHALAEAALLAPLLA